MRSSTATRRRPRRGARRALVGGALGTLGALLFGGGAGSPLAATGEASSPCAVRFVERASERDILFLHESGARGERHLPETMGAGVAWIDYDGDGWQDLYLVQSGPFPPDGSATARNRLFRNSGGGRAFVDVTEESASGLRDYGQGVLAVDLDGRFGPDLWLTSWGGETVLWNRGDGTFRPSPGDLPPEARSTAEAVPWSTSAVAADFDRDGDLDVFVTRYVEYDPDNDFFCGDPEGEGARRDYCDPSLFPGQRDAYYESALRGRDGSLAAEDTAGAASPRFRWSAPESGLWSGLELRPPGKGLGATATDLDGDGWVDLYVANDITLNELFRNDFGGAAGGFVDESLLSGAAVNAEGRAEAGMGVAVTESDGDHLPEIAVTNFDVETNTLYGNLGGLAFEDRATASGFGLPSFNRLGFGLVAADFDLDGREDFFVANGHIFEHPKRQNVTYAQPDVLLLAAGQGLYVEAPCALAGVPEAVGRGAAVADLDRDGDPDVAVSNSAGAPHLLVNQRIAARGDAAAWLAVELVGAGPGRDAVGATAALISGGAVQRRWVRAGDSYLSSSARELLFAALDSTDADGGAGGALEVRWPSGRRTRLEGVPAGRRIRLYEEGSS